MPVAKAIVKMILQQVEVLALNVLYKTHKLSIAKKMLQQQPLPLMELHKKILLQ
jgi:hypothetical protein